MKRKSAMIALISCSVLAWGAAPALAELTFDWDWYGTIYMKFLDGNRKTQDGLYNLGSTAPGAKKGGDQGQGTELELFMLGKISDQVEINCRLKSRFNTNYWTNGGGWIEDGKLQYIIQSQDGSVIDKPLQDFATSSQYIKLRGVQVHITPGYTWIDSATIGSNDWGQFDELTVGKMRYIDRDNQLGLLFQGSLLEKTLRWDLARISVFDRAFGPGWNTGGDNTNIGDGFNAQDAAYVLQLKYNGIDSLNLTGIGVYLRDEEVNEADVNPDGGQDMKLRSQNAVGGLKAAYSFEFMDVGIDVGAAAYYADYKVDTDITFAEKAETAQWSPLLNKDADDFAGKIDLLVRPFDNFSTAIQIFHFGSDYQAYMAQRREGDVLLTEGHDATWGNRYPLDMDMEMGWGGWDGTAQQLPTLNIDNEFTDFDEPMTETCLGWQGVTIVPRYQIGNLSLQGEFTFLGYDTNWQAFGIDDPASTDYPLLEANGGVGVMSTYRSAYAPFQDKRTLISVLNWEYILDVGEGVDFFGKFKWIDEEDKRVKESKYLVDGSTPYYGGYPTHVVDPYGVTGYEHDPFDDLSDDDRDLDYYMTKFGFGYQLFEDLYAKFYYEYYYADLKDGTTAFYPPLGAGTWSAPYQTGIHQKNIFAIHLDYFLSGLEFGLDAQWIFGEYSPRFYGDHVFTENPDGVLGVSTGDGIFVPDVDRQFKQYRLKAWLKVKF